MAQGYAMPPAMAISVGELPDASALTRSAYAVPGPLMQSRGGLAVGQPGNMMSSTTIPASSVGAVSYVYAAAPSMVMPAAPQNQQPPPPKPKKKTCCC
mmetsp:Transcript_49020/g.106768  ORF Transcript_49020/g.106768 Transcript_49020/m.106768 type:complete len:98 (+) Transcript_49020:48-341(+)